MKQVSRSFFLSNFPVNKADDLFNDSAYLIMDSRKKQYVEKHIVFNERPEAFFNKEAKDLLRNMPFRIYSLFTLHQFLKDNVNQSFYFSLDQFSEKIEDHDIQNIVFFLFLIKFKLVEKMNHMNRLETYKNFDVEHYDFLNQYGFDLVNFMIHDMQIDFDAYLPEFVNVLTDYSFKFIFILYDMKLLEKIICNYWIYRIYHLFDQHLKINLFVQPKFKYILN